MARKKKKKLAPKASEEALDTLVQQFSQPLAFLRELIQNSLDARTNRIEVNIDYEDSEGCARVQVTDWGEGMNREVIETQLTRLFSSTKEGDLTSIGKFGIGFVSVFATRPQAVTVDTGRDGESWRVLFHEDRSFELLARDEPIEGTRVTSYIPLTRGQLGKFRKDCLATVEFWCKHCDVEILVQGKPINQAFELGLPGEVRLQVTGSEVVAAPSLQDHAFCGFYNRGLTLLESQESPRPGVAFKLRSVYLEHTLTRDNVVQDKHFHKAMAVVDRAIHELMPREVLEEVRRHPEDPELWRLAERFLKRLPRFPADCLEVPVFPGHLSFRQLQAARQVACSSEEGPLVESLRSQNIAILPDQAHVVSLARLRVPVVPAEEGWFLARESPLEGPLEHLLSTASRLLGGQALRGGDLELCSGEARSLSLLASTPGRAEPWKGTRKLRLVNLSHPLVQDLAELAGHDLSLASYLLARALLLQSGGQGERQALEVAIKLRRAT